MSGRGEDHGGSSVRVNSVPGGREFMIDGTFASWYEPGSQVTGSVWDALATPLLLLPPRRRRRVLILGLGGGSAARVVRALAPRARIVGVELDAGVIELARREFDLDELGVEVICADARAYLEGLRARFDLVIDDIFIGKGQGVRKPQWSLEGGIERAASRVAAGGALSCNTIDETRKVVPIVCRSFPTTLRIDIAGFDNRVLVGCEEGMTAVELRARVAAEPLFSRVLPLLSFRTLDRKPR